ncbi:histidine kinase [Halopseudomonas oceani]|uniref:histidine kinase n=1 Tax=Halopseudomonas oceani TaxID=1708783 RepID=UPI002AA6AE98|nr:histidine kinase [Halopseudomonas oceani]
MSRQTPNHDNLFLRCYANLRRRSLTLAGAMPLMVIAPLLLMLILVLWLGKVQLQQDVAQQADRVGSALARQIAASAAEPLAAEDRLSLNILLAQWNQNPMIAHVSLYSPGNRLIAEAGSEPPRQQRAPGQGNYIAAVHLQDQLTGQVQLTLAATPFILPANLLLERMIWGLLLVGCGAGLLAWHRGRELSRQLEALALWDATPSYPAPACTRSDELGALSRALLSNRGLTPPEPEPEPEPEDVTTPMPEVPSFETDAIPVLQPEQQIGADEPPQDEPAQQEAVDVAADSSSDTTESLDETAATEPQDSNPAEERVQKQAMLAVRLGNHDALRRLPRERLMQLLERYRQQVQHACQLYGGEQHTLHDGTSIALFRDSTGDGSELKHGLCCGELLRVLGHDLQIEIADTGIALHMQLALGHASGLDGLDDETLGQHEACQRVIEHLQHSRNLLLVDAELAASEALSHCASTRRLASQPGTFCIERLLEPYQSLLERQLSSLYNQRQS